MLSFQHWFAIIFVAASILVRSWRHVDSEINETIVDQQLTISMHWLRALITQSICVKDWLFWSEIEVWFDMTEWISHRFRWLLIMARCGDPRWNWIWNDSIDWKFRADRRWIRPPTDVAGVALHDISAALYDRLVLIVSGLTPGTTLGDL